MGSFHWVDFLIFAFVFVASAGIGIYHGVVGSRQGTPGSYLLGDRKLKLIPVTLSMIVSLLSGNTLLGSPAETYSFGVNIALKVVTTTLGALVAAFLFVPVLYPLKILSVNDYLEMRFKSLYVRRLGGLLLLVSQTLYIGCVVVGSSVTLETATGLPSWASILLVTVVGTAYTTVGGLKGVIWTDVFQSVIMLLGILSVVILGVIKIGGINKVWRLNVEWERTKINTGAAITERMNLLGFMLAFVFPWIALYGINQTHVQRYNSMPTLTKAVAALLMNPPGFALFHLLATFLGMVMFAYYADKGCDPLSSGQINNPNQLLVFFVLELLSYPGLPGAFVSALVCAAMSSQSSSLNSMAAVLWDDFFAQRYKHWSQGKQAKFIKISVVFFGVLCGCASFLILAIGGNLIQLAASLFSNTLGPLLGLFFLGLFVPFANGKGAMFGGVVALGICIWLLTGQTIYKLHRDRLPLPIHNCSAGLNATSMFNATATSYPYTDWNHMDNTTFSMTPDASDELTGPLKWFYSISFLWFGCIGMVVTLILGTIGSAVTGGNGKERVPGKLLAPGIRQLFGDNDTEKEKDPDEEHKKDLLEVKDYYEPTKI